MIDEESIIFSLLKAFHKLCTMTLTKGEEGDGEKG